MRIRYLAFVLFLGGCAGAAAQGQIHSALNRESVAWNQVDVASQKVCPKAPVTRTKAMEAYGCVTKLINAYVRPVSTNPLGLDRYITTSKRNALAYKNGKIGRDEVNLRNEEAMNVYKSEILNMANAHLTAAQQRDMITSQNMQAMSQQMNQMEMQRQQSMAPMFRTTDCNMVGNNMHCRTH